MKIYEDWSAIIRTTKRRHYKQLLKIGIEPSRKIKHLFYTEYHYLNIPEVLAVVKGVDK